MPDRPHGHPDLLRAASNADRPRIYAFCLGPFQTNCYVVTPAGGVADAMGRAPGTPDTPCWIIDAGFDPDELIEFIRTERLVPKAIILTHAHCDHIAGLFDIRSAFPGVPILIHPAERSWLTDPMANLSGVFGMPITGPEPDRLINDGELLELAEGAQNASQWRVIHTPGHSPGGITLYHAGSAQAIVGDTLFAHSIGRSDFPGSDPSLLEASIRRKLYRLPDDTTVYPGHGPSTTIGREKRSNPYVPA
jgi:glyoxylase-like metal-dependent hydrolase (beta-lactamase superfamily II)